MIELGDKIKALRQRDGRTQDALAVALGVTAQAVSRWEKGICYPDMELIPSIANYFSVSIDELFGYDNERTKKVDALFHRITEMNRNNDGVDRNLDDCIQLARESLIEFPGNEKLTAALASALFNAGYVRKGEQHVEEDGFLVYDVKTHKLYPEWQEAIKLYEKLVPALADGEFKQQAVLELAQLYQNTGEHEKAMVLSDSAPELNGSKSMLRIKAFDGKEAVAASGEALLETVRCSAELIEEIVRSDRSIPPKKAAALLENAVNMFGLVFTDGDFGKMNGLIACLQMLRSYYLWLGGEREDAFAALHKALASAKALDQLSIVQYSSPLLRHIKRVRVTNNSTLAAELPELWPWWDVPARETVKAEMQDDPRWVEWENKAATV